MTKDKQGILLDLETLQNKGLTLSEKVIYSYINSFIKNNLEFFASNSHIANTLGLSEITVKKSVARLLKIELFCRYKNEQGKFCLGIKNILDSIKNIPRGYKKYTSNGIKNIPNEYKKDTHIIKDNKDYNKDILFIAQDTNSSIKNIPTQTSLKHELKLVPKKEQKDLIIKPKKTRFNLKTSITPEQYQTILNDKFLANGDREYLLNCAMHMQDWSESNGKLKVNWYATLRNWIRSNRNKGILPNGIKNKNAPKTFRQMDEDDRQAMYDEFLKEDF